MSNDDPFTLDLFGNTALSSGLGLGVTAFGSDFGAEDPDDDPILLPPVAGARTPARPQPPDTGGDNTATARGQNFFLAGDRGLAKGWKQRARDNIAAIRLAAEIEADERPATPRSRSG
jgi:hypothetical protein